MARSSTILQSEGDPISQICLAVHTSAAGRVSDYNIGHAAIIMVSILVPSNIVAVGNIDATRKIEMGLAQQTGVDSGGAA